MSGLILTRKIDQSLYIGTAKVMVVGVERDRVKLLIEAPDNVTILREELLAPKPPRRESVRTAVKRRIGI